MNFWKVYLFLLFQTALFHTSDLYQGEYLLIAIETPPFIRISIFYLSNTLFPSGFLIGEMRMTVKMKGKILFPLLFSKK